MTQKIVIFGASGDLAIRKLIPNIYDLKNPDIELIAYTRSALGESYIEKLKKYNDYSESFLNGIKYIQGHYHDLSSLIPITDDQTILYFSVPPSVYEDLLNETQKLKYKAIGVEKPFGIDFESFQSLACFNDSRIYFIDHYLLKNLSIVLPEILTENMFSFISKKTVHSVEAKFHESILAEGRAFFDKAGIVQDVMQNHLIEILATVISEREYSDENNSLKNNNFSDSTSNQTVSNSEFVRNNLKESKRRTEIIKHMEIQKGSEIFGQYEGYCDEINAFSKTETFGAFFLTVSTEKWNGVPFFFSAGKGLSKKCTEICLNIKTEFIKETISKMRIIYRNREIPEKLKLIFRFSPTSEILISAKFDQKYISKEIFSDSEIEKCVFEVFGEKRDYGIIFDCLLNSKEFPNSKHSEVYEMWRLFENILKIHKSEFFYKTGVDFPDEAKEKYKSFINYD